MMQFSLYLQVVHDNLEMTTSEIIEKFPKSLDRWSLSPRIKPTSIHLPRYY